MAEIDAIVVELKSLENTVCDVKEYIKSQDEQNRKANEHMVRCQMLHASAADAIKKNYDAICKGHEDMIRVDRELTKKISAVDNKKQPPVGKLLAIAVAFLSLLIVLIKYIEG